MKGQNTMAKNTVSPMAKRQLQIKISDHWATKIKYTPENDAEFYEKLGHLTAQLMGQEEYIPDASMKAVSVVEVETTEEPTVVAFFYSTIENLRTGKWTLNRALELEHLPMGMRVKDFNGKETGEIRFSVKNMTKAAAHAVVKDNPTVFTRVEFSDAAVLERAAARAAEKAKKVIENAGIVKPKKEKKLRPIKQTQQEIVDELFNQPELPEEEIDNHTHEENSVKEEEIHDNKENSEETIEETSAFEKSVEDLLNETIVEEEKKEEVVIDDATLDDLMSI